MLRAAADGVLLDARDRERCESASSTPATKPPRRDGPTIAANAVARTPTSKFTFDGDVNYRKYWGPGADGAPSESLGGDAKLHYETYGKDSSNRDWIEAGAANQIDPTLILAGRPRRSAKISRGAKPVPSPMCERGSGPRISRRT